MGPDSPLTGGPWARSQSSPHQDQTSSLAGSQVIWDNPKVRHWWVHLGQAGESMNGRKEEEDLKSAQDTKH